jgi:hypothetical protein
VSWLELDDGILRHPKFIRAIRLAGSEAIHLWLGLRAYCGQLLTDGEIPADMVDAVDGPSGKRARNSALEALISVGLIEKTDVGLRMHDYLDWSRSREEIEAKRQANAKRQRNHRESVPPVTRDKPVTNALVTVSVTAPSPLPSPPIRSPPVPDRIPPAERVTSEKPIEPNQFEQALAVYGRTWQARYHRPYEPTPPDKSHLGRWWSKAALWQREQWPQIVSRYIGNTEAFFVKRTSSHSLTWLVTKGINEFTGPPPPSKEAIAAAELERHKRIRASERSAGPGDLFGLIGNLTDGKSLAPEEDEELGRARVAAQMRARGVT